MSADSLGGPPSPSPLPSSPSTGEGGAKTRGKADQVLYVPRHRREGPTSTTCSTVLPNIDMDWRDSKAIDFGPRTGTGTGIGYKSTSPRSARDIDTDRVVDRPQGGLILKEDVGRERRGRDFDATSLRTYGDCNGSTSRGWDVDVGSTGLSGVLGGLSLGPTEAKEERPLTSDVVARRLIGRSLGLGLVEDAVQRSRVEEARGRRDAGLRDAVEREDAVAAAFDE